MEQPLLAREKFRTSRFARGLTLFAVIVTILQIGRVTIAKEGVSPLLGAFSSLFLILSYQVKDDWLDKILMLLSLVCLAGCWFS